MLKSTQRCKFPTKAISLALTYITSNVFIIRVDTSEKFALRWINTSSLSYILTKH